MANEITITSTIRVDKGGTDLTFPSDGSPFTITMTGTEIMWNRQIVGTSEEALDTNDVDIMANGAWFYGVNRDSTNFIEIRPVTGGADLVKLRPGEPCGPFLITTTANALFVIADTASCVLEYILIEA